MLTALSSHTHSPDSSFRVCIRLDERWNREQVPPCSFGNIGKYISPFSKNQASRPVPKKPRLTSFLLIPPPLTRVFAIAHGWTGDGIWVPFRLFREHKYVLACLSHPLLYRCLCPFSKPSLEHLLSPEEHRLISFSTHTASPDASFCALYG